MAYEVTARRTRPQKLEELIGQEFVVTTLKTSFKTGQTAQAFLFSGPRGVGKTSTARILAKMFNCLEDQPEKRPCNQCSTCTEITGGSYLDVIEIDGASNTSVNDIRQIKDEVMFRPNTGRKKVYIIDEVHMLSNSAFNALLKTIEEPPEYIVFIFATTEIHKVPATILSRCQQYNFQLISNESIVALLAKVCKEAKITAEDDALYWVAKESTGSIRDAYTLLDQVIAFCDSAITLEKIKEKLGLAGVEELNQLLELVLTKDSALVFGYLDKLLSKGVAIEQLITDLIEYMRNILFIKNGICKESILGYSAARFSAKVSESFSIQVIEKILELLLKLYRDIRYSFHPRFELELLLSRMMHYENFLFPQDILNRIHSIQELLSAAETPLPPVSNTAVPAEKKTENPVSSNAVPTTAEPKEILAALIEFFKKKKLTLSAALEKASDAELIHNVLSLYFSSTYAADIAVKNAGEIQEKLKEITNLPLTLKIHHKKQQEPKAPEDLDKRIELIKKVFKGQIIKGE